VICDATDVPMGIGGVMGGHLSEISAGTRRVLLEAAEFLPVGVGRTARHLGLRSEASVRFERGIDPLGIERASARVAELVVEAAVAAGVAPPVVAPGLADACPRPFTQGRVSVRPSRVNALLGTDLSADEMTELLEPIGYRSGAAGAAGGAAGGDVVGATLELKVPSFRPDVQTEVDVIEDVARTYGYGNIARTERRSPYVGRLDATQLLRRRLKRILCGLGAHEAWTSSIVDPADHARAGWEGPLVRLTNPMVAEESALRAGLLAGLLAAVRHNTGHRHPFIRLFEIGDVFGAPLPGDELPAEPELVALILAGEGDGAVTAVEAWHVLADALGVEGVELVQSPPGETEDGRRFDGLHATRSAALVVAASGMRLGTVGEVDPSVLVAFGLPHERIGWLEIDMARLAEAPRRALLAKPVSRYPSSDVDLAFVVDADVLASKVESALRQAAGELCESIDLFDVYRGAGVGTGKRSLAYRLRFCALDHTLTDGEVGALREECIKAVEARLPAVLRS
jgi:phenylalanyl-tRNA synthetase beta chain